MEKIFDDGPNSYELGYGLPGQSLLENTNYSGRRIHAIGNNFYQRSFYNEMINKSRRLAGQEFANQAIDNEMNDESLYKYFNDGRGRKRKRVSTMDLILEEQPHLREYARQRTLVGLNLKRRMVKSFQKAGSMQLKKLARSTKITQAHDCLSKLVPNMMKASQKKARP